MDTKTLIHIGVEVVVIGGIVFHFQRKISKLDGEIQLLRDENTKLKQDVENIFKILKMHDQILRGNLPQRPVHKIHEHVPPQQSPSQNGDGGDSTPPPSDIPKNEEPEDEIPEEELDDLLKEELFGLKTPASDFIEIECVEENTSTVDKPAKKKVLRPKNQVNG